ncbi:MAG: hypothetical protein QOD66_3230, partial [Solirubrobacteraceae bacterium]|nr:hypothetical protein [Solirubrobacteraceae bacterium]
MLGVADTYLGATRPSGAVLGQSQGTTIVPGAVRAYLAVKCHATSAPTEVSACKSQCCSRT